VLEPLVASPATTSFPSGNTSIRLSAVALFRGRGERQGKTLDNPACLRIRIVSG
jgi:hypothetical protein